VGTIGRRWARKHFNPGRVRALPKTVTLNRLAVDLGVALSTVQHWLKLGLKAEKIGNRWKVCRSDVAQFLGKSSRLGSGRKKQ
jgi:hypothetical protein